MTTAATLHEQYVGRTALARCDAPHVRIMVTILDARERFGRIDLLVQPRDGDGQDWTSLHRLTLVD